MTRARRALFSDHRTAASLEASDQHIPLMWLHSLFGFALLNKDRYFVHLSYRRLPPAHRLHGNSATPSRAICPFLTLSICSTPEQAVLATTTALAADVLHAPRPAGPGLARRLGIGLVSSRRRSVPDVRRRECVQTTEATE